MTEPNNEDAGTVIPAGDDPRARGSDWFAGDVDCDGNELVTVPAVELRRLRDEREKFMWQVRDTCTRAETAEAALAALTRDKDAAVEAERQACAGIAEGRCMEAEMHEAVMPLSKAAEERWRARADVADLIAADIRARGDI